ncbi:MAG TPA: Rubrerythrin [Thermoplasmatales archaeon]|nr:Rubrerythrin [Thermoplasmatales archaeon]
MDLGRYSLEELFLSAIKSEVDSRDLYKMMSSQTSNGLLKDKLGFLAKEEEKHRLILEDMYRKKVSKEKVVLPEETPVPLPKVEVREDTPMSVVFKQAMEAEKAAYDFYNSLADRVKDDGSMFNTLRYFARMEMEHYRILEIEKEGAERFEEADVYWPMVHVGP